MKAVSWAWDQKAGSSEAKLVLVLLADATGDDGRVALRRGLIAWVEPFRLAILPIDAKASELARALIADQGA